jgi:NAD(P)-dependent dehydrogenase (short-subunit alcohol dehydrogenase family)
MLKSEPKSVPKVILVTGYSRGIGRAWVEEHRRRFPLDRLIYLGRQRPLAEPSVDGWVRADLAQPLTGETQAEMLNQISIVSRSVLRSVESAPSDGSLHESLPHSLSLGGYLDGFFHAAGVVGPLGAVTADPNAVRETFQVNLHALTEAVSAVQPLLKTAQLLRQGSGEVPFVCHLSSGAAQTAYADLPHYCSSKAAALMQARCLAAAFSFNELQVFALAPGRVRTDMTQNLVKTAPDEWPGLQAFRDLAASGGYADPVDVARSIDVLLFDRQWSQRRQQIHGRLYDLRKPNEADGVLL